MHRVHLDARDTACLFPICDLPEVVQLAGKAFITQITCVLPETAEHGRPIESL